MPDPSVPRVVAHADPALRARVLRRVPLRYRGGADAALDRPAHVRAGSGLAWVDGPRGRRLAVVQDDAHFVALVDPRDGLAAAIVLPAGPGGLRQFDDGRGNKDEKLDLEALVAVPDAAGTTVLLALGSGARPRREHAVLVRGAGGDGARVDERHLPSLYAALRAERAFAGSEMNVEGAVLVGDALRLLARGNGAARDGERPLDATCDLPWAELRAHLDAPDAVPPPRPRGVVQYALGDVDGVALGFTDATARGDGAVLYTAAAEASADAVQDGAVAGSALGVVDARGARWTELRDEHGARFAAKVEGIALDPDDARRAWVVVDRDAHDAASELCEVALDGAW